VGFGYLSASFNSQPYVNGVRMVRWLRSCTVPTGGYTQRTGQQTSQRQKDGFLNSIQLVDGITPLGNLSFGGAGCIAVQIL
jgi:hypothetical protein